MAAEKKEKKGPMKLIIIIIGVLVLVFASVAGGYMIAAKSTKATVASTAAPKVVEVKNPLLSTNTLALDDFLVNLSDAGSKKYLKIKVVFGYEDTAVKTEITSESKLPVIRDCIISLLRSKTSADLQNQKGEDALKKEISDKINPLLSSTIGKITNVYFNDIIIQ